MIDELDLEAREDNRLRCVVCVESMESEGYDRFELIQTTHYWPDLAAPEFIEP